MTKNTRQKRRVLRRCVVQERGGATYLEQQKLWETSAHSLQKSIFGNKFEWIWPHI
jgi:hypothetical protein